MIPEFMLKSDVTPNCSTADPDAFFPIDDFNDRSGAKMPSTYANERAAKAVCEECPLKLPCALYAIRTGPQGIWGGTTESERTAIRRGRGIRLQKSLGLEPTKRR